MLSRNLKQESNSEMLRRYFLGDTTLFEEEAAQGRDADELECRFVLKLRNPILFIALGLSVVICTLFVGRF